MFPHIQILCWKTVKWLSEFFHFYLDIYSSYTRHYQLSLRGNYQFRKWCIHEQVFLLYKKHCVECCREFKVSLQLCPQMTFSPVGLIIHVHIHTLKTTWSEWKHRKGGEKTLQFVGGVGATASGGEYLDWPWWTCQNHGTGRHCCGHTVFYIYFSSAIENVPKNQRTLN